MAVKNEDGVAPVGSTPQGQETPPPDTAEETPAQKPIKVGDKEYGSVDDLGKAYTSLQTKLGEQGKSMGELKGQNKLLSDQLAAMQQQFQQTQQQSQQAQAPQADFESQMADIYQQIDNGDMSVEEGLRASTDLTARMVTERAQDATQRAVAKAQEQFQATLQERDGQQKFEAWSKENPDFMKMRESGVLQQAIQQNPMLGDEITAYYAVQAQQASAQAQEASAKIADGAQNTGTVLNKPGSSITNTNPLKGPRSETEKREAMLAAVRGARAG